MGKIGDLWVLLGLKKDGFDKGIDQAVDKTKDGGSKMEGALNKVKAGWAIVGASAVAAAKFIADSFIESTNKMGDAWNRFQEGIKAGWQSVMADMANVNIWDVIFDRNGARQQILMNAVIAKELANEMTKAFDAEFDLENSLKIQRAKIQGQLADLQVEMMNVGLTPAQRLAAAEQYKALLEPLYEAEIATRKNMLDAAVQAWLGGRASATTEEVVDFFANYGIDPSKAGAMYPELMAIYESFKGDTQNQIIFDAITKLEAAESGLAVELKRVNRTVNTVNNALSTIEESTAELGRRDMTLPAMGGIFGQAEMGDNTLPDLVPDDWLTRNREKIDAVIAEKERLAAAGEMLADALTSGTNAALDELANVIAGVEGANMGSVVQALLSPLADAAVSAGMLILTSGEAVEAFKSSLTSLNGYAALAAGAALVAVGVAAKAGLAAIGKGNASGTTTSTYGGSSAEADVQNIQTELTVYVKGRISGSDIVIAGQKTTSNWKR